MERMMSTAPEMYDFCKSERTFNPSDRDFCTIMQEVEEDLLRVVHGDPEEYAAIPFCGSSAVCIDACVSSLVPEQGRILILNNGSSAARAAEAARNYHIDYSELRMPLDRPLDTGALELALQRDPRISAVYCCMHETDTGVLNPVKEIGSIAHRYNKVMIADVSSAFAILPIDVNEDCLDFLIGSAREGLRPAPVLPLFSEKRICWSCRRTARPGLAAAICISSIRRYRIWENWGRCCRFRPCAIHGRDCRIISWKANSPAGSAIGQSGTPFAAGSSAWDFRWRFRWFTSPIL